VIIIDPVVPEPMPTKTPLPKPEMIRIIDSRMWFITLGNIEFSRKIDYCFFRPIDYLIRI